MTWGRQSSEPAHPVFLEPPDLAIAKLVAAREKTSSSSAPPLVLVCSMVQRRTRSGPSNGHDLDELLESCKVSGVTGVEPR